MAKQNLHLTFPYIVVSDKVHAHVIASDGRVKKHELRLPKKCTVTSIVVVGDDLAVSYRDDMYQNHFYWVSDPTRLYDSNSYYMRGDVPMATAITDGSVFLGQQVVRSGEKQMPGSQPYFHDAQRFCAHDARIPSSDG